MANRQKRESRLKNIGPVSKNWLNSVGILTWEDLNREGVVGAYNLVLSAGFNPSLNLAYALYGALHDCHWQEIPETDKERIREDIATKTKFSKGKAIRRKSVHIRRKN